MTQLFALNHLVNSFLFEHFNSPFSGTKSEVSVTRTEFTGNYLGVKIKSKGDTFRPIATGLSGLVSHMLNS